MLKQKLKRMVLTGATVMVLMSTAAATAAMAAPAGYQGVYQDLAVYQIANPGGTIIVGDTTGNNG